MEADWSIALGAGDPVITVPWQTPSGCRFVDLRRALDRVDELPEVQERPVLRSAILVLNAPASPFLTAKCDAWTSSTEEGGPLFDPYEMDADPEEVACGAGSYVDLLHVDRTIRSSFDCQERWIRAATERLRATPAKAVRIELVLRHASLEAESAFAVTWFVEGCGRTIQQAQQRWAVALNLALPILMDTRCDAPGDGTIVPTGE